ncbi:MAG TPA: RHS repeat-associated core domain-containing protein, partial [Kineosporiaceae bacterium]|nr:RHS repeat-associated core domain-containing protein [Kineosporiaceae bacterium]
MAGWGVLGLGADPVPGDAAGVRGLVARLGDFADVAGTGGSRLREVAGGSLGLRGDFAQGYVAALEALPEELGKLERAWRGCAGALARYAGGLELAQERAGVALRRGVEADARWEAARREAAGLLPAGVALPWGADGALSVTAADAATLGLDEGVRAQVRAAVMRAGQAAADRAAARRLVEEAAQLRGQAETRAVTEIDQALAGSGIANKAWYEKAWDTVSAPFRSWDAFVGFCEKVALVAGVVALFVSGPLGWALMAAAVVAGGVILADKLNRYARGQASLLDVGIAVLGVIPGGRGVFSVSKLAGAARGLVPALVAGGGKALGQGAYGLRTAIPHGLAIVGGLRGAATDPVLFGRALLCRAFKADPIDVATGQMFQQITDVHLPASLPLTITRVHQSGTRYGHRLGASWVSSLDQRIEVDDAGITATGADGMIHTFPHPADGQTVLPHEGPRLELRPVPTPTGPGYTLTDPLTRITHRYAPLTGLPGVTALPLVAITHPAGHTITYEHDADGHLTAITHHGGYRLLLEHTDGLVTAVHLATSRATTPGGPAADEAGADEAGADGTQPDGAGNERGGGRVALVRYRYDPAGRLTEVVNSSGLALTYSYDLAGRVTGWTDRNGTFYRYVYDAQGRCVAAEGTDGTLRARLDYDTVAAPGGTRVGRTRFTDSLGCTTHYEINDRHQVVSRTDPTGAVWTTDWDRHHRQIAARDPLGRSTAHDYDAAGRLLRTVLPDATSRAIGYDCDGLPVSVTGPDGATWTVAYDSRGLPASVTDPTGATTHYTHDAHGNPVTVTDALGGVTHITCNPAGLPVSVTDPGGAATRIHRDPFGRPVAVTDPVGGTTRYSWTPEGLLTRRIDPDGAVWTWSYDPEHNLIAHTDPAGHTTRYTPTAFDQTAAVTTPDGATTRYTYDTERRLTAVTNPQGLTWHYQHDPNGLLIGQVDFDDRRTTYERDPAGQVTRTVNALGQATTYAYDVRGNLTTESTADGRTTRYHHDPAGRLIHATTSGGPDDPVTTTLTLTRDPLGRITAETLDGRTLANAYDALGRRTRRTTPTGATSTWTYDAAGHPLQLAADGHALTFGHDPAGHEISRTMGVTTLSQAWSPAHRLLSQILSGATTATGGTGDGLLRRGYEYDPTGHLTQLTDGQARRRYTLDSRHRVAIVAGATPSGDEWSERYDYDSAGNITHALWPVPDHAPAAGDPGARGPREYSGTRIARAGTVSYSHDALGRLTTRRRHRLSAKDQVWSYTWNARNQLTTVRTPDGDTWTYSYDPLGRRTAKHRLAADGTITETTTFTWDGAQLAETCHSTAGAPDAVTTFDHHPHAFTPLTQRTRRRRPTRPRDTPEPTGQPPLPPAPGPQGSDPSQDWYDEQFYGIVSDLVGTPTELLTPDGEIAWQARRTTWGAPLPEGPSDSPGGPFCPLLFPGQYHDPETGLAYNVFRYYDPTTARYTSPDPLGLAGGPNPAAYVSNPYHWIDPLGLTPYGAGPGETLPLFHGTTLGNVAGIRATGIDLARANPRTDFGAGFYTTADHAQALLRAGGNPAGVLEFRLDRSAFDGLSGRTFTSGDDDYAEFLRAVRQEGGHPYDYVSGPVLAQPRNFYLGSTPVTFGNQTSFHTSVAISILF